MKKKTLPYSMLPYTIGRRWTQSGNLSLELTEIIWENSDIKWMKAPSIYTIVNKYLTVLTIWITFEKDLS